MKKGRSLPEEDKLRRQAEAHLQSRMDPTTVEESAADSQSLLHELRVHQIELEIQNEELRRSQAKLEAAQAHYFELFELAPVGYLTLNFQGMILEANLTAAQLLGSARGIMLKQALPAYIHPEDQELYHHHRVRLQATGSPQAVELRLIKPDASHFWARLEARQALAGDGTAVFRTVLIDIDARKRAEEALRLADRQKDQFIATLSHELRNPLAPIRIGLGILRRARDNPDMTERTLDLLDRQMLLLVRLIDELMEISRITSGKIKLQTSAVELATVLQQAAELSLPLITESGHTLHLNLPEEPILLNADPFRLGQVFANLLNNSAKFTPQGGLVSVNVEQRNDTVAVRVLDTGIGIPPAMLDRIFDIFTQVDQSLEKDYGGLGIGLSLVKELVSLHGGTVEARSEGEGRGSEFIVRLPCATPTSAALDPRIDQATASKAFVARRILIADDNHFVRAALSMLIEAIGHQVAIARDGLEAVKLAEEFSPELILLDIGMPKLNGFDACQRIRQQPWGRDVFIAAVTGWGSGSDKEKAKEAGFDQYLVKPVDTEEFEILIKSLPEKSVE